MERIIYCGTEFCAVQEDGLLVEYLNKDDVSQSGSILIGTVDRIMPALSCAFVDIGRNRAAFLPLKENSLTFSGSELRSGMKIAVQIRKEQTSSKGAYLTRDLTLAGKLILLMPENRYVGVSSRITDEKAREKLRETGQKISAGKYGIIMREASRRADETAISQEYELLKCVWEEVSCNFNRFSENGTILYNADPIRQLITDYEGKGETVIKNVETLPAKLERQLRQTSERQIGIRNGGNIIIDRCEAMTVIDVNTGSAYLNGNGKSLLTETNFAACETIAVQIRLRDLSGIIIIDFIDMDSETDRERVAEHLRDQLSRDRRKTVIHGWTRLGLLEMTRKRTG